jgi:hypothetical protein
MKFRIVELTKDGWKQTETTDLMSWMIGRPDVEITGTLNRKGPRAELQGQPYLSGFAGPMWDGDAIRYENSEANDRLSA